MSNRNRPATPNQISYLDALTKEMVTLSVSATAYSLEGAEDYATAAADVVNSLEGYEARGDLTVANASKAIDYIVESNRSLKAKIVQHKTAQLKAGYTPPSVTRTEFAKADAGVYKDPTGRIFRVYYGQQSGQMLSKEVVGSKFQYRGLADRIVKDAVKLSLDEAKAWGKTTGTCIACGRKLDVPESVDAGIGPVCAGKF